MQLELPSAKEDWPLFEAAYLRGDRVPVSNCAHCENKRTRREARLERFRENNCSPALNLFDARRPDVT